MCSASDVDVDFNVFLTRGDTKVSTGRCEVWRGAVEVMPTQPASTPGSQSGASSFSMKEFLG